MKKELTIKEALAKALSFQQSGLTTQAKEIYETILQEENSCFDACFNLGNCLKQNRDYKNALIYFKKAIKIDNKSYMCHFNIEQPFPL